MILSIIIVGRNDNYGERFLERTQCCIDNIFTLAPQHKLDGELILVEWNPPADRPTMDQAIDWKNATIPTRVIRVPRSIHAKFERSNTFNLFEYTAKNVGIRRSKGKFVLVINADILLSSDMIAFLAGDKLEEGNFYRAIREPHLPQGTGLYFGASGDFLMMSRNKWETIKGYPEVSHNAHVDSSGVHYADLAGLRQVILQQKIIHMPHKCDRAGLYEPIWDAWPPQNIHESWGFRDSPEIIEIRIL